MTCVVWWIIKRRMKLTQTGTLLGILIFALFVFDKSLLQDSLQGPGRSAFLWNMALISFNPIRSGGLISIIFGGLGGLVWLLIPDIRQIEKTAFQNYIS